MENKENKNKKINNEKKEVEEVEEIENEKINPKERFNYMHPDSLYILDEEGNWINSSGKLLE